MSWDEGHTYTVESREKRKPSGNEQEGREGLKSREKSRLREAETGRGGEQEAGQRTSRQ